MVSPSQELRKWFGHDPEKYAEFKAKYLAELEENPESMEFTEECGKLLQEGNLTLLFGAKDEEHNNAVVLREWLIGKLGL